MNRGKLLHHPEFKNMFSDHGVRKCQLAKRCGWISIAFLISVKRNS